MHQVSIGKEDKQKEKEIKKFANENEVYIAIVRIFFLFLVGY